MFAILRDKGLLKNETHSTDDLKHVAERAQARTSSRAASRKSAGYTRSTLFFGRGNRETAGSTQAEVEDLSQLNAAVERMTPRSRRPHSPGGPAAASSSGGLDRITTRSPEALKNFIEGETLFFEGNSRKAPRLTGTRSGSTETSPWLGRGLAAASCTKASG